MGCETAVFLVEQWKKVTIIEMLKEVAADVEPIRKSFLMQRLNGGGVEILTAARVKEILKHGMVEIEHCGKKMTAGPYDTIVLALGAKPNNDIVNKIIGKCSKVYVIGDVLKVRKAIDAIADGSLVGWDI